MLSLTVGEETRAYPLRVLTWHEIANDVVDGVPVAVTYCPLCNSGVAFERTVEGEETTFGVSGLLYADNLVMFDRATESLWPQLTGQASVGVRTGTQLRSIPMGTVGWAQFREEHPDALVLNRDDRPRPRLRPQPLRRLRRPRLRPDLPAARRSPTTGSPPRRGWSASAPAPTRSRSSAAGSPTSARSPVGVGDRAR